jgi:MFS family permease
MEASVSYTHFELPFLPTNRRVSAFFSSASLSGAFSGLLAYGIIHMNGVGGRPGWAWIFILEGLFTVVFGVISFFILPRSPAHARFLNEREKAYVVEELKKDGATGRSEAVDRFSWREVRQAFVLPQVWMIAVLFFLNGKLVFFLLGCENDFDVLI